MIALFGLAMAATIAVSLTHGWIMEACMGIAGLLWIIVIVRATRHHDRT
jgi:hypothetical protein